jgi:tetratricopeptide (TPR) repeat protein
MVLDPRPRLQIGLAGELEPAPLIMGALTVLFLVFLCVKGMRHPPPPQVSGLLATSAAALGLVLHVLPLPVTTLTADRFLYLPLAALAPILAGAAGRLGARIARPLLAAALALLIVDAFLTVVRNEDWDDEPRLWRKTVETTDRRNPLPLVELAGSLVRQGTLEEALVMYHRALAGSAVRGSRATGDTLRVALAGLASTLLGLGRFDEARAVQLQLLAHDPDRPASHYTLAAIDVRLLRFDDARAELEDALRLYPGYAEARRALDSLPGLRREAAALSPESEQEPVEIRAQRARFWTKLVVPGRALPLWTRVVGDSAATLAVVQEGAAYIVMNADDAAAARAIARARAAGADARVLQTLEAVRYDRAASTDE